MRRIILSLLVVLCGISSGMAQNVAQFKDGDRIVFLGDSITDFSHYHSYIWLYYLTRFPEMDIRIYNAGIGGDTVLHMYERLDGDVFARRPDVLLVTFGMNDTSYFENEAEDPKAYADELYNECAANYALLEKRLKEAEGLRVVMMGSTPYDEYADFQAEGIGARILPGKNAALKRVSAMQQQSAAANGWEFMDFHEPIVAVQKKINETAPEWTFTSNDRIHPEQDTQMLMASIFLESQGFKGNKVADIRLDARGKKVSLQENCEISSLTVDGNTVSFDYLARSLPYPLDTIPRGWMITRTQADVEKLIPFNETMNQELLAVDGLKGDWALTIDGVELGTWSAQEWEKGINMAELTFSPQYQQALEVMHLNEYRWEIERSLRIYAWIQYSFFQEKGMLDVNDKRAVELYDSLKEGNAWLKGYRGDWDRFRLASVREARTQEIELLSRAMNQVNKPKSHRIILKKRR